MLQNIRPFGLAMFSGEISQSINRYLKQGHNEHSSRGGGGGGCDLTAIGGGACRVEGVSHGAGAHSIEGKKWQAKAEHIAQDIWGCSAFMLSKWDSYCNSGPLWGGGIVELTLEPCNSVMVW